MRRLLLVLVLLLAGCGDDDEIAPDWLVAGIEVVGAA